MEFWMASRMLMGNLGRGIFSLLGITGAVGALVMTLSLGRGGREIISSNLGAIGGNRILVGANNLGEKDLKIVENMPFVEYGLFPEARVQEDDYVIMGYSQRALEKKGIENLGLNQVAIDGGQIHKKVGELLNINGKNYSIGDIYREKNPLETMKRGKRVIVSMENFYRNFGRGNYRSMVVAFPQGENSEEYIPIVLKTLSRYHGYGDRVQLLETPEVYKSVERVRVLVNRILYTLSFIALGVGALGIMNLIGVSVRNSRGTIGILKSMGMDRNSIMKIFLYQGIIVIVLGTLVGTIGGIIGSYVGGKLINIPPIFNIFEIIVSILIVSGASLTLGLKPGLDGSKIEVMEALKN
ncbi:MAG: ABC transporter permease [Cetobacterium sp.]